MKHRRLLVSSVIVISIGFIFNFVGPDLTLYAIQHRLELMFLIGYSMPGVGEILIIGGVLGVGLSGLLNLLGRKPKPSQAQMPQQELDYQFCNLCGEKNPKAATYCSKCGSKM